MTINFFFIPAYIPNFAIENKLAALQLSFLPMRIRTHKSINILIIISAIILLVTSSCSSHEDDINKSIDEIYELINAGDYEGAQLKTLQTSNFGLSRKLLAYDTTPEHHEAFARALGIIYYQQSIKDKAKEYNQAALKYATEMGDTALMITNLYNLGLCSGKADESLAVFSQAAQLARQSGKTRMEASALEKLAQVYISIEDFAAARRVLDASDALFNNSETEVTRCRLLLAEGDYDAAMQGYKALDSLNVYGQLMRASAICDILTQKEDYRNAIIYKDSVYLFTDSIKQLDGRKQVEETEKTYLAGLAAKNLRFKILMWSSAVAIAVVILILFFVSKNLRLKKRQTELADRISALNAQIAQLRPKDCELPECEATTVSGDLTAVTPLIKQKFELSGEMFRSLPAYTLLKKLNLLRDMSADNRSETKTVYDVIVGRFSDCCSDIRQAFPAMTNDDCIFCAMNYIGCSKEVVSVSMGSSEEALRRRKSRIKQKLPESVFNFFFTR